jgi:hypothetical protein
MLAYLHDFLYSGALLADDPSYEVVVREDLERGLLVLADALGLLRHHFQNAAAGGAAVLRLPVHRDGFLQLAHLSARRLHFPATANFNTVPVPHIEGKGSFVI